MRIKFHIIFVLTLMAVAFAHLHSAGQDRKFNVPSEVKMAFVLRFPAGHLKKWVERHDEFIATFRQDGKKCLAYFTSGGIWKATERPVKWTRNLPEAVMAGWNNCKYISWFILDMKRIEVPYQTLYAIHVGQIQSLGPDDADIGSEYILYFSDKGELIREDKPNDPDVP